MSPAGVGGADLKHYRRTTRREAAGAADSAGQHRHAAAGRPAAALAGGGLTSNAATSPTRSDDEDETSFWREYLLYQPRGRLRLPGGRRGRLELGAPADRRARRCGATARSWQGTTYRQLQLRAQGDLGAGRVLLARARDERRRWSDYIRAPATAGKRLSREQTGRGDLVGRRDAAGRHRGRGLRLRRDARRAAARHRTAAAQQGGGMVAGQMLFIVVSWC
jgi:hypothetical protein